MHKIRFAGSEIIALGQRIELTKTSLNDAQKVKISKLVFYDWYENFEHKKLTFYQKKWS